jgi:VWFA-related protein
MRRSIAFLCATTIVVTTVPPALNAQSKPATPSVPTINVTSSLVYLDVTVLDKNGRPVDSGLTKDDFTITDDKKPQTIYSFESPEAHRASAGAEDENPSGTAPVTILVMDRLNSSSKDFAYIRYEVEKFLKAQHSTLASPTELLILGNESLELVQSFTQSRAQLLEAVEQLPPVLPYKFVSGSFAAERAGQSLDALDQIALQNKGVPGRKNIVWVGRGTPALYLENNSLPSDFVAQMKQNVHATTNMLVQARISLFVIYPGLSVRYGAMTLTESDSVTDLGDSDPFAGDINFGLFANATGGKLFYNHNNVAMEMKESERMGSHYYTLTYQPQNVVPDGKFRRIRVTLRNPDLRAVTKAGYYAEDAKNPIDPRQQQWMKLSEAVQSTLPFDSLNLALSSVVRHPDTQTVGFTVDVKSKNLKFDPSQNGTSTARLVVAAASLNQDGKILASRTQTITLIAHSSDPVNLPEVASQFPFILRIPHKTSTVRVIVQQQEGGRIGSAEINRTALLAAPATNSTSSPPQTSGQ